MRYAKGPQLHPPSSTHSWLAAKELRDRKDPAVEFSLLCALFTDRRNLIPAFNANGIHSFFVHYGPGSPFGSDKIVLAGLSDNLALVLTQLNIIATVAQRSDGP